MHADCSIINLVKKSMTIKKIRVLLSDPDATDSSSDEGSNEKNTKIHEIVSDQKKMASLEPKVESNKKNMKYRKVWSGKSRKRFPGVRISKSGKFAAVIRDPVKKKTIWLGTFNTAEEAYDAFLAKKREFNASQGIQWEAIDYKESERDGLSNEQSPSLMPETEALDSPANTGSEFFNDSSSSSINTEIMKIETLECNGGCVMGMLIPVPGRQKDNSGQKFFLPIVDNHGFLLGEFSKLDDLSIPDG